MKKHSVHKILVALMLAATAAFAQQDVDAIKDKGTGRQPAARAQQPTNNGSPHWPLHYAFVISVAVNRRSIPP